MIKKIFALFLIFNLQAAKESIGFLFAHGFGLTMDQIHWYKEGNSNNWYILSEPCRSFNFPEVNEDGSVNFKKVNFGQKDDVEAMRIAHEKFCQEHNLEWAVLVGMSRGASAIVNYAASNPKKIKALILEAPFDSIENVIALQLRRRYIGYIPGVTPLACTLANKVWPTYKSNGLKPLRSITKIDKAMPILFIHSKQDGLVSFDSSKTLYAKLKRRGYKNIHFLELENKAHCKYQKGDGALKYRDTVHAFYRKYNIPHNKDFADRGQELLDKL